MEPWMPVFSQAFPVGLRPIGRLAKTAYGGLMKTREMRNKLQDWQKQATEKVQDAGEEVDRYVRENTWQTLAVAAVCGCIVGFLLANRRD